MIAQPLPAISSDRRRVRLVVVHCTDTPDDRTLFTGQYAMPAWRDPAMEIDAWHRERGFHRDTYWRGRQNAHLVAIGYHYVVARNGALFTGRHEDEPGAHVQGWNAASLGVCLVGRHRYTAHQWLRLRELVNGLSGRLDIPLAAPRVREEGGRRRILQSGICGHRDLPGVAKRCPGFDVAAWLAGDMQPLQEHVA